MGLFAAATGVALALVGAYRLVEVADPARRRRRIRLLLGGAIIALALGAAGGVAYQYYQSLERERDEAARAAAGAVRQARHHEFIAAFVSAAPRPDWWDRVETPYRVETVGDLLAAWQGHPRGEARRAAVFQGRLSGHRGSPG